MVRPAYAAPAGEHVWRLNVWVQPGGKSNAVMGEYQGCLKVRLHAPAVDNKANKALITFIATLTGVKENGIHLERGHKNRRKVLLLTSPCEPDWEALAGSASNP